MAKFLAYNFLTIALLSIALRTLTANQLFIAASDAIASPTNVSDLVNTTLDLLIDGESGLWHLANAGAIAWRLGAACRRSSRTGQHLCRCTPAKELNWVAPRPVYSALTSERGLLLPSLDSAIGRYLNEHMPRL